MKIQEKYIPFFNAMVAWNHKKNWKNFKTLWVNCAEDWVPMWSPLRLWFIIKDTINGKYVTIEKEVSK